jgi:hypothetical protein
VAITSLPMSVGAGHEYDQWILRLTTGIKELIADGSAPPFTGLDRFLVLSDRLRAAVKTAADRASRAGQSTFTVEVPFTDAEQRMLADMGSSLLSFVEILALRGKIDAGMSPAVAEAIAAMTPADY